MSRYLFTPELKTTVDEILAPLKNPGIWKKMGLPFAKTPRAIVRLEGGTGCGKTSLADYMARALEQPPLTMSFADVASSVLGDTENRITALFKTAHEQQIKTVIMEECESLLLSRSKISDDTTYLYGFLDTILREIDKFIARDFPSLLILATNHPEAIDSAIESRITDVIRLEPPSGTFAVSLWRSKLPQPLRDDITTKELNTLAKRGMTPREIENEILRLARRALHQGRDMAFSDFSID